MPTKLRTFIYNQFNLVCYDTHTICVCRRKAQGKIIAEKSISSCNFHSIHTKEMQCLCEKRRTYKVRAPNKRTSLRMNEGPSQKILLWRTPQLCTCIHARTHISACIRAHCLVCKHWCLSLSFLFIGKIYDIYSKDKARDNRKTKVE